MPPTTNKDRHATGSADWVASQVQRKLRDESVWAWIRDVFPDVVIAETEAGLVSIPYTISGNDLTIGEPAEVGVDYVLKQMAQVDLTGPIVKQEEDKRIVTAPVLVPDEPDSDGDVVTADQIERVAHLWMSKYQNVDFMHTLNNVATPIESYVAPVDLDFPGGMVPKGSWVLSARVPEELWEDVKKGGLRGFSLMAVQGDPTALAIKSEAELVAAAKRVTLADLGEDWIVPFVSIVDAPAVPKAKWVAMKRAGDGPGPKGAPPEATTPTKSAPASGSPETSLMDKLRALFVSDEGVGAGAPSGPGAGPSAEKEGRRFSNATYSQLKKAVEALSALLEEAEKERDNSKKGADDMTPEEIQTYVDKAVDKSIEGLRESIAEFKEIVATAPVDDQTGDDTDDVEKSEREQELEDHLGTVQAEFEAFKAEVEKRLASAPKSLVGQDDDSDAPASKPAADEYTDAFGIRYRRDAAGRARRVM